MVQLPPRPVFAAPRASLVALALLLAPAACGEADPTAPGAGPPDEPGASPPPVESGAPTDAAPAAPAEAGAPADGGEDAGPPPRPLAVDRTSPKLWATAFAPKDADPAATLALGTEGGWLDTRVAPAGKLVVYLHGATNGFPASCVANEVGNVLTAKGFHVLMPCYRAEYGVGTCGDDIGGCRLEAFEGKDHTPAITVAPADGIEPRVVAALKHLAQKHPGGDWTWFLDGDTPRWRDIVIAGISHGASTSGLVSKVREVDRAVMLSGPLDTNQAWLALPSKTPVERVFGFTHTADGQHAGHLAAFVTMKLPGAPTRVDGATAPYGGSHRLVTSAATNNGHGSTAPGGSSPKRGDAYVFAPVWTTMFGR